MLLDVVVLDALDDWRTALAALTGRSFSQPCRHSGTVPVAGDTVGDGGEVSHSVDRLRCVTILNDDQRRVLTFIRAANHGGYSPPPAEVLEWALRPDLKQGKVTRRQVRPWGPLSAQAAHLQMMEALKPSISSFVSIARLWDDGEVEEREPDETLIEQVLRFRWVKRSADGTGLLLTQLGSALLRADADLTTAAEITVLGSDDPLAWGSLVGIIAEAGDCVIVDPYLKLDQLLTLAQFTSTSRVIMRRPNKDSELAAWRVCLASPDLKVEMRMGDPKLLHDRFIVSETAVYTLGCSLNIVGRKPTTLAPLTGEVAEQIRTTVEGWWGAAEPIGEPPEPEPEPELDDGEIGSVGDDADSGDERLAP